MNISGLLSRDDWMYAGILFLSFGLSWLLRVVRNEFLLKHTVGFIGLLLVFIVIGQKIVYSLILSIFTIICIKFVPNRILPLTVFVGSFCYIILLRVLHLYIDVAELASHTNVVQLIMTLRAVGISFEISDKRKAIKNGAKTDKESRPLRYIPCEPNMLEIFNYLYHFCGLFTGPYYTYTMYMDSLTILLKNEVSPINEISWRLKRLFWSVPMFVLSNYFFPLDGLRSDVILSWSFFYHLIYAAAVFVAFRGRVYSAWAISESICVTLGIGIYPTRSKPAIVVGPRDTENIEALLIDKTQEFDTKAIDNLDIYQVEFSDGYRNGVRAWNKSVQTWLALYVYGRTSKAYRTELTMFVSALWHGTYAGYFMSFLIVPMCFAMDGIIFSYIPADKNGNRHPVFRWIYWLTLRSRGFDMLATGFLLKNFHDVHRFWSCLYYWLLLIVFPIYMLNMLVQKLGIRNSKRKVENKQE